MTVRERFLAIVVLGFIVLAGAGLMISQFIWSPIRNRAATPTDRSSSSAALRKTRESRRFSPHGS